VLGSTVQLGNEYATVVGVVREGFAFPVSHAEPCDVAEVLLGFFPPHAAHHIGASLGTLDMWSTCSHATNMPKMVQIRNVPDALHRKLKARAAIAGQSLSDYLLAEISRIAALPTRDEMLARIHSRTCATLKTSAAAVIREERESA
jgi:antitoxin FitA